MFRTPAAEPAPDVSTEATPEPLIPLSHLALDLPVPPEGWSNFLGRRGIMLRPDDIGRDSIRRSDAQVLLHEQRANELRAAKHRQLAEAEAVEADQLRRALIWKGVPADRHPSRCAACRCDAAGSQRQPAAQTVCAAARFEQRGCAGVPPLRRDG